MLVALPEMVSDFICNRWTLAWKCPVHFGKLWAWFVRPYSAKPQQPVCRDSGSRRPEKVVARRMLWQWGL